ncbi:hypothetical protein V8B97DRAFT_1686193 [Scleroderma yunnanense]
MLSRFAKLFCMTVIALFILATLASLHPPTRAYFDPWTGDLWGEGGVEKDLRVSYPHGDSGTTGVVGGGVIMSKLGNETAKYVLFAYITRECCSQNIVLCRAELGRATWKLLHTMTLRFPEVCIYLFSSYRCHTLHLSQHPTADQREALSSYMYLTSRLYPCGECAAEFQELLKKFPPQVRIASYTFIHLRVDFSYS